MKTQEFLALLKTHQNKSLVFSYGENKLVAPNYHITEVKNITVDSVDCGAGTDFWKETVIQLWESPSEIGKKEFMSSYKALGILTKVDRIKPMVLEAEVKFEYSNAAFHTAQLFVGSHIVLDDKLLLNLQIAKTDCKAKESCGIPETVGAETTTSSCTPGSGCC